jgi:hypothetical protein
MPDDEAVETDVTIQLPEGSPKVPIDRACRCGSQTRPAGVGRKTTTIEIGVVPVIMGLSFIVLLRECIPVEIVKIISLITPIIK